MTTRTYGRKAATSLGRLLTWSQYGRFSLPPWRFCMTMVWYTPYFSSVWPSELPVTLHLSHQTNAALTALGGRVHAATRPDRTPQGRRDPVGFRRKRAAHCDRSGTQPPIIWTA